MEQLGVQLPLSEVMLLEKEDRLKIQRDQSYIYKCLLRVWDRYKKWLVPSMSPLMSFIHHPQFWEAVKCSDFSYWERGNMDHFYQLGRDTRMLTKQHAVQKVGVFPRQDYQYNQVRNLVGELQKAPNIFRRITQFESLLKSGGKKTNFLSFILCCYPCLRLRME